MKSEIKRLAIRRFALEATVKQFSLWHQAQAADQPSPVEWQRMIGGLSENDMKTLDQIRQAMLSGSEIEQLSDLLAECGSVTARLYQGDKQYMHEIRCLVLDAITELQEGHPAAAYRLLEKATSRLSWLIHDRKRDGFEPKRMIPADVLPRMRDTHRKTTELLALVGRAAAVV